MTMLKTRKPRVRMEMDHGRRRGKPRYIYGAKNTGNIKKYYGAKPSVEQIYNNAGGNSDSQLSYESTFLVLSTRFTPTGGSLMLDGPSYGQQLRLLTLLVNELNTIRLRWLVHRL